MIARVCVLMYVPWWKDTSLFVCKSVLHALTTQAEQGRTHGVCTTAVHPRLLMRLRVSCGARSASMSASLCALVPWGVG